MPQSLARRDSFRDKSVIGEGNEDGDVPFAVEVLREEDLLPISWFDWYVGVVVLAYAGEGEEGLVHRRERRFHGVVTTRTHDQPVERVPPPIAVHTCAPRPR